MYRYIKRFFDIVLSGAAIIVLSPFLLIMALMVKASMGSPVLFRQQRVGKDEKVFTMYKFRSMNNKTDENGNLLPDSQRVSKLGSFLRSSSLDEIPEIFLIFAGKMSIIGPRPLPPAYLSYYTPEEHKRHNVRGGLVSPEVLYNDINPTWNNQLKYEVDYSENVSFVLDIRIFFATFKGVFNRFKTSYGVVDRPGLDVERKSYANSSTQKEHI